MFGRKKPRPDETTAAQASSVRDSGSDGPRFDGGPAAASPPSAPYSGTQEDMEAHASQPGQYTWVTPVTPPGRTDGADTVHDSATESPAASAPVGGAWASQVRSMTVGNGAPASSEVAVDDQTGPHGHGARDRNPEGGSGDSRAEGTGSHQASAHPSLAAVVSRETGASPSRETERAESGDARRVSRQPEEVVSRETAQDQAHVPAQSGAGRDERPLQTPAGRATSVAPTDGPSVTTGKIDSYPQYEAGAVNDSPAFEDSRGGGNDSAGRVSGGSVSSGGHVQGGEASDSESREHVSRQTTSGENDSDERRRAALVESLPEASEDTPLMAQLQQDARRRIELRGRRFPRPPATRVVTVANQKGGVGKTTTTVNLAAALAQSGLNVLVLDNDPQGNASTAIGIEHRAGTPSIYEVLVDGAPMHEAVQESPDVPNLFCLPATIDLSGAEIELVSMVARETRLRNALDAYLTWRATNGLEPIDYVFVDCPPSLGLLTVNAFVVAREVLIPIQCEYYALEGLSQLLKTIELIQAHLNPNLHVSTILLTMYDARTNLAQQVASEVRTHFPELTLRTTVPRSVRISEAPSYGQTVMTYDPGSSGALAYLEAAREVAERGAAGVDATARAGAEGARP